MLFGGWMALIFAISSQPSPPVPMLFHGLGRLVPVLFFGILGLFLARSPAPPEVISWKWMHLITIPSYGLQHDGRILPDVCPRPGDERVGCAADGAGGVVAAGTLHSLVLSPPREISLTKA
jgi:hypothetical protein